MNKYIKKDVQKHFFNFNRELPENGYDTGSTWEDYLNNKWVPLTEEQWEFHENNPYASVKEVWNMELLHPIIVERTLEQAKREKIQNIEQYDNSLNVNSFTISIGEQQIDSWLTPDQRANYKNSLDSAELLGLTEVHPVFGGQQLTIPTQKAKMALAQIQLYADRCFIVTQMHKAAVEALDSIEAVDAYNFATDYPEKPVFNV